MVQAQQSREQGVLTGENENEDAPIELDEHARRFLRLFREEEHRRAGPAAESRLSHACA